jgi:hypothetical protein
MEEQIAGIRKNIQGLMVANFAASAVFLLLWWFFSRGLNPLPAFPSEFIPFFGYYFEILGIFGLIASCWSLWWLTRCISQVEDAAKKRKRPEIWQTRLIPIPMFGFTVLRISKKKASVEGEKTPEQTLFAISSSTNPKDAMPLLNKTLNSIEPVGAMALTNKEDPLPIALMHNKRCYLVIHVLPPPLASMIP